jgi:hypothetical protein
MPMYYVVCRECETKSRIVCKPGDFAKYNCKACGGPWSRDTEPHPPSSQATETLDNGAMVRKLERLADAERLFKERSELNKQKNGQR